MTDASDHQSTPAQRWLARLSLALAGLAIAILVILAGLKSLTMLAVGLAAAVVSLVGATCHAVAGHADEAPAYDLLAIVCDGLRAPTS